MAIENKNSRLPKVTCLLNVNSTRSPFSHPCIYLRTLQRLGVRQQKKSLIFTLQLYFILFPSRGGAAILNGDRSAYGNPLGAISKSYEIPTEFIPTARSQIYDTINFILNGKACDGLISSVQRHQLFDELFRVDMVIAVVREIRIDRIDYRLGIEHPIGCYYDRLSNWLRHLWRRRSAEFHGIQVFAQCRLFRGDWQLADGRLEEVGHLALVRREVQTVLFRGIERCVVRHFRRTVGGQVAVDDGIAAFCDTRGRDDALNQARLNEIKKFRQFRRWTVIAVRDGKDDIVLFIGSGRFVQQSGCCQFDGDCGHFSVLGL